MVEFTTTYIIPAISIIATIYAILCNNKKAKKQKLVEIAKISQKTLEYICEAEQIFGTKQGNSKLAFVLNKIEMECIKKHVEFDENDWKVEIEKILKTPQKKEQKDEQ